MWTREELDRYARHIILPEVGAEGQRRLKQTSGAGGLGAPLLLYLAAAGVGRIGIVEMDTVDLSNLQRQVLYATTDVGRSKAEAARERVVALNPHVRVEVHPVLGAYDVIVDASDNFPTRYLVNDAAVLLDKPLVYGAIYRFEGQVAVFHHAGGPCYRFLFPKPPDPGAVPNCAEAGVFGVLPGVVGSLMAAEVIKLILGVGEVLAGRLLLYDALAASFRTVRFPRNRNCPVCGDAPSVTELIDYEAFCAAGSKSDSMPTETS